jgi:hypothetical protein
VVEAASWVAQQSRSVVLLHHEDYTETQHRRTATTDTFMPLSEEEIASYQVRIFEVFILWHHDYFALTLKIFYWSFFVFGWLLLAGVFAILNMEVIPDSLLYAKFQSSRTGKTD